MNANPAPADIGFATNATASERVDNVIHTFRRGTHAKLVALVAENPNGMA
jgi:hypothetical protein